MSELQKPFILFADDDEETLKALGTYARLLDWNYDLVSSARGIIEKVNEVCGDGHCYDVIVADVNYYDAHPESGPRLTGITAALEVRKTHPDMPIVFVTGFQTYFVRKEINNVNGELFVKPVDFVKLFERLEFLVDWRRLVSRGGYRGPERRVNSINVSGNCRRRTDHRELKVPKRIADNILEAKAQKHGGTN